MPQKKVSWFTCFAKWISRFTGKPITFLLAFTTIIVWAITGPLFGFSDTWQLVINTGTTIVTFLMVFLIQNTQNRDTEALQIKLEELDEKDLDEIRKEYRALAEKERKLLKKVKKT